MRKIIFKIILSLGVIFMCCLIMNGNALAVLGESKIVKPRGPILIEKDIIEVKRILEQNPNDLDAHIKLGYLFLEQQKIDEAKNEFRQLITINPDMPRLIPVYKTLGQLYFLDNKPEEAKKMYEMAIKLLSYEGIGWLEDFLDEYYYKLMTDISKKEEIKWKEIVIEDPNNDKAHYNLGEAYLMLYNLMPSHREYLLKAEKEFKKAIEIDPQYVDAYLGLASLDDNPGRLISLLKNIKDKGNNKEVFSSLGGAYYRMAIIERHNDPRGSIYDLEKAQEYLKQVINIDSKDYSAYYSLACVYILLDKSDEAKKELEKTIEINPNFAIAFVKLGEICYKNKQFDLAFKYFQEAKRLSYHSVLNKEYEDFLSSRKK